MHFGEYLKIKRMKINESLRGFCLEHNLDPGNISKLERGVILPPKDLSHIAQALGFKIEGEEFKDLVSMAENTMAWAPSSDVANRLPRFFTLDNQNLTKGKLDSVISFLLKDGETLSIDQMSSITDRLQKLMRDCNYIIIDQILLSLNEESSIELIITYLRTTFSVRHKLDSWEEVLLRAKIWITNKGRDPNALLIGMTE